VREFWRQHPWRPGEERWHWHILPAVRATEALTSAYALAERDGIDAIPASWLHMTLLDLGPVAGLAPASVERMTAAVRARCGGLPPFGLTLGPAHLAADAVHARVAPPGPVDDVRNALVAAVGQALGSVPAGGFFPHLSLGYGAHDRADDTALQAWLDERHPVPVPVTVDRLSLVRQHEDRARRQYRWTVEAEAELRGAQPG